MANLPEVCLLECLMPPSGYSLKCVVGTSYSLNPNTLLAMLVAASTPRANDEGFTLEDRSKEEILYAIQDSASKSLIFVDHHGALQEIGSFSPHEKLVLNAVVKKEGRANNSCGSLHGKVLIALFKGVKGDYRGRVYVGSKNFTQTDYDEFGLVAEFEQTRSAQGDAFCGGVEAYLIYLHAYETIRVKNHNKLDPLRTALEVLKSGRFRCVVPNAQFHWQGRFLDGMRAATWATLHEGALRWLKAGAPDNVYIHSPWVRRGALDHLMTLCGKKTKVFVRCLDDRQLGISGDKRIAYEFYHSSDGSLEPHQSHAKIYLFKRGRDALLAFGSANCTPDGWAIDVPNCRPNAEVLVTVTGPFAKFAQLTITHANALGKRDATPREKDAIDRALDYLSGIRADVDYDFHRNELCYPFQLPLSNPDKVKNIEVSHDLVEQNEDLDHVMVWQGQGLPAGKPVRVPWDEKLLYFLSPILRIRDRDTGAEVHLVLDLDVRFFDGREKLKCLSYSPSEFVQSLARLMEFSLDGHSDPSKGIRDEIDDIARFIRGLRLERYLYRMGKLKCQSRAEFDATIARVERLLELKPSDPRLSKGAFSEAIRAIKQCHRVLHEA